MFVSTQARSLSLLLFAAIHGYGAALSGCSEAHADLPHADRHEPVVQTAARVAAPEAAARSIAASNATEPTTNAEPATDTTHERIVRALGTQREYAEMMSGNALAIDFGTRDASKYTLGGWLAGNYDDGQVDGATALIMHSPQLKVHVPAESTQATVLEMRARTYRADRLHTYVNGREIGAPVTSGTGYQTLRVSIPANALRRGENLIQLRADSSQNVAALGGRVTFALDWMRLGDEASLATEFPSENAAENTTGALRTIANTAWRFTSELPTGAHLRAQVNGDAQARVAVRVEADGESAPLLETTVASGAIDVDLSAAQGKLARVEMRAVGGAVTMDNARIVTLDAQQAAAARRPKHVLLYLIDTLRADRLQPINPQSRVRTPGLDRFVRNAAVMTGAHTQENWTKPSVTTLLSSLLPWQHNATTTEAVVPEDITLLPEILSSEGFFTGAFIANGYVSDRFGFKQGWSTYRNYIREGRNSPAQYVAADVLEWLDARPNEQPFFLYVHTIDPHVPYRPPANFLSMYESNPYSGPIDFSRDGEMLEKIKIGRVAVNDRDKTHLQALYDGEISYHDVHFDSIMQGLERRGLADDTLVVITADHGEEFWDHGSVGHGHSVYEELLHIPLFVRWPGVTNELTRIDHAVGLVDIMPTILEVLGKQVPSDIAGSSFASVLRGQSPAAPRTTVSGFMEGWRAGVSGRWKVVQRGAERAQLFNLQADPHEQRDIAATHPIALRYARALLGLNMGSGAPAMHAPSAPANGTTPRPNAAQSAARARPVVHQQQTTTIDAETEAQLRALGYVGSSRR